MTSTNVFSEIPSNVSPDIYPDIPGDSPVDLEYSERGRGLQNDPITFPEETQPVAGPLTRGTYNTNVPCVHLALRDTHELSTPPVRSTRTALAACSASLLVQPVLLNSPPLHNSLLAFSSLPGRSSLFPLLFLFTLPALFLLLDLYSLPTLFFSLNNMHSLLSLHSLTSLPAMLDLTYLEHSAFGEG